MNATITKKKATTKKRPEIERVYYVEISGGYYQDFSVALCPEQKVNKHFLVNTDKFKQFIPKHSVIEVDPDPYSDLIQPGDLALMSGAGGFKIMPYKKTDHLRVIGPIAHVECWPGRIVEKLKH